MAEGKQRFSLTAPKDVITAAKATLGGIDFDPYGTVDSNRLINAIRMFNRDQEELEEILRRDWRPPGKRRTFFGAPMPAKPCRSLLNKLLREYRSGSISEAVLWIQQNETLTRCPWLHDFPLCYPFRRLRPCWYDDETETYRNVAPADWSVVVYLPPADDARDWFSRVSRFHSSFAPLGRIVLNEYSGEGDWEESYKQLFKSSYNYRA